MKRLLRKLERLTLQSKLIISYIYIILIPMLVISTYIFNEFHDKYIHEIEKKNETMLEIEKINIDNNIETMARAAQLSISDKEVIDYLERSSELDPEELIDFNATAYTNLTRMHFNNPNIDHIRIFSPNPYISEIWPVFFQESRIQDQPWYEAVGAKHGMELWEFSKTDYEVLNRSVSDSNRFRPKVSLLREIVYQQKHLGLIEVGMFLDS